MLSQFILQTELLIHIAVLTMLRVVICLLIWLDLAEEILSQIMDFLQVSEVSLHCI